MQSFKSFYCVCAIVERFNSKTVPNWTIISLFFALQICVKQLLAHVIDGHKWYFKLYKNYLTVDYMCEVQIFVKFANERLTCKKFC